MTSVALTASPLQILLPQLICFALNRSIIRNETEEHLRDRIKELNLKVEDLQLKLVNTAQENLKLQETSKTQQSNLASTEQKLNETAQKFQYAYQVIDTLIPDLGLVFTEAVATGNSSLITPLIQINAPVNIRDVHGYTPMFWAIVDDDADIGRQLLRAGTDINVLHGDNNDTLLHIAARYGNTDIVQELLKLKADPNGQNKIKNTPLHEAAWFGHEEVAKFLLGAGAHVDSWNGNNITPLLFAAEKGHLPVVQVLVQSGANRNVRNKAGRTPQEEAQHRGKQNVSWWLRQQK